MRSKIVSRGCKRRPWALLRCLKVHLERHLAPHAGSPGPTRRSQGTLRGQVEAQGVPGAPWGSQKESKKGPKIEPGGGHEKGSKNDHFLEVSGGSKLSSRLDETLIFISLGKQMNGKRVICFTSYVYGNACFHFSRRLPRSGSSLVLSVSSVCPVVSVSSPVSPAVSRVSRRLQRFLLYLLSSSVVCVSPVVCRVCRSLPACAESMVSVRRVPFTSRRVPYTHRRDM